MKIQLAQKALNCRRCGGDLRSSKKVYKTRKWYISHEILSFHTKHPSLRRRKITVWENLVLINARNPNEAHRKATEHGRLSEQDVKIDGKDGICKFDGIKDLVLVYDKLESGTELEWHGLQLSEPEIKRMVRRKQQMQAFNIGPKSVSRRAKK
jgi:Domain of unknown function (DUF4288)